jgi:glutathione S-transferase
MTSGFEGDHHVVSIPEMSPRLRCAILNKSCGDPIWRLVTRLLGLPRLRLFQNRIHCIPQAADDLKASAQEKLTWLDGLMAGKQYVCGDRLTLADILLFVFLDFFASIKQPLNENNRNILAWYGRMKQRPSAAA